MYKLFLCGLLCLDACSLNTPVCDNNTDAIIENICVHKNGLEVSNKDFRKAINIIDSIWSEKFDVDIGEMSNKYIDPDLNTSVEFMEQINGGQYGLTENCSKVSLKYEPCIANTALGHEMLHILGCSYGMNFGHNNPELFLTEKDLKDSLENVINIVLCQSFCESSCEWFRIK